MLLQRFYLFIFCIWNDFHYLHFHSHSVLNKFHSLPAILTHIFHTAHVRFISITIIMFFSTHVQRKNKTENKIALTMVKQHRRLLNIDCCFCLTINVRRQAHSILSNSIENVDNTHSACATAGHISWEISLGRHLTKVLQHRRKNIRVFKKKKLYVASLLLDSGWIYGYANK